MTNSIKKLADKISGLFGHIRISTKIIFGFGLLLALMLISSGVGIYSFMNVGRDIGIYSTQVKQGVIAARIKSKFLTLQIHAANFASMMDGDLPESIQGIRDELKTGISQFKDPKLAKRIHGIDTKFETYAKSVVMAAKLQKENDHLIDKVMLPAGEKIVAGIDKILKIAVEEDSSNAMIHADAARKHAFQARLYMNILVGRHIQAYAGRATQEFKELAAAFKSLGETVRTEENKRLFSETRGLFQKYEAAFKTVYKEELEIRNLVDVEMLDASDGIVDDLEWLESRAADLETKFRDETQSIVTESVFLMVALTVLAIVLGLITAVSLGRIIGRPVVRMTDAMKRLSEGDNTVEIPARNQTDEIGQMARSVQVFKENSIRMEEMRVEAEEALITASEQRKAGRLKLADEFEASVKSLVEAVSDSAASMRGTAQDMSSMVDMSSSQAAAASAATEQASASVQTVSAAAEELSASISEIGRQVATSAEKSRAAVRDAEETNVSVLSLAEGAKKIGDVIELINDVAEQTNLLALNATIEAARAGEAGKGFAVVASEVKSLADQTAKATEEIGAQIASMQSATGEAVAAIDGIGRIIGEMDGISASIASAVEQQGAATTEISGNAQQAAEGTQEASSNVVQLTAVSKNTGEASVRVLEAADGMLQQTSDLDKEVQRFLTNIRNG
jgi:methyl-accepting chemotaxis protein